MARRARIAKGLILAGLGIGLGLRARRAPADLRGQVALVTGSSRGLGFLLAREFAAAGCRVVICARDAAELERARAALAAQGAEVLAVACDVADRAQVERLVAAATERFGRVDILVNNAGIIQVGPLATMTAADFEAAMDVIFWGAANATLALLPQMRARRSGRIVTISSIGGRVSVPHLLPYNCAKFALTGFSEGLRAELAREGISVTTVVPGLMRTGSPLNAIVKGNTAVEFAWFAIADSLPLLSMDAERAASAIVQATRRGDAECVLTLPALLAARVHGLAPGLTADVLGLVNRLLPTGAGEEATAQRGAEARAQLDSPLVDRLIGATLAAAERFHQHPAPSTAARAATPAGAPADQKGDAAHTAATNAGGHAHS
jgi:NAD(P)-dependent dehydrogenase (short-subunit alcohol dehydrogenase family)